MRENVFSAAAPRRIGALRPPCACAWRVMGGDVRAQVPGPRGLCAYLYRSRVRYGRRWSVHGLAHAQLALVGVIMIIIMISE